MASNLEHLEALDFLKAESRTLVKRSLKKLKLIIGDKEALTFTKLEDWSKEYETQREKLHNVERRLNSHEAGCYKFDVLAMPTHSTFVEAIERDLGDFFDNELEEAAQEATGVFTEGLEKPKAKSNLKPRKKKAKK